jgi:hypothetical protein
MKKNIIYVLTIALFGVIGFFSSNVAQAAEGDLWLSPVTSSVNPGNSFDVEVHMDTGGKNLGAFNITFNFTASEVEFDLTQGDVETDGKKGMSKGADTSGSFMMLNAEHVNSGEYSFAGIAGSNWANGSDVHLATLHLKTKASFVSGSSNLSMVLNEASDELGHALETGVVGTGNVSDEVSPVVSEVIPVQTPTNDTTPNYTFSSTEAGTITYGGNCSSTNTTAVSGNNTVIFNTLTDGTYNNCTITVTDAASNVSSVLNITSFQVNASASDTTAPTIVESVAVETPTNDDTPDYTFTSNEAGTITYSGDCASSNTSATVGENTVTFNTLTEGTHSNCTITVIDAAGNISGTLNVASFNIDTTAPTLAEVTAVSTPPNDDTPDYTFSSTEAGTITYGGSCSSTNTTAISGNNTITFSSLADGTYSNCTITVTDATGNASSVLNVSSFAVDAPPVRSNGQPTDNLALGTTQVTISLDTNKNATCKYSTSPGVDYATMTNTFTTTGGMNHSQLVTGLIDGNSYNYYVRCIDTTSSLANDNDFTISFSINATCTEFTYTKWSACQPNEKQTRSVTSSTPSGCTGGGPIVEQNCIYIKKNVNDFTPKVKLKGLRKKYKLRKKKKVYLRKKKLKFKGRIEELAGGRVELLIDGKIKDGGNIGSDGMWRISKKIKKTGTHKLKFKYYDKDGNFIGESSRYKIKIDTKKPKFINLSRFLTKRAGDTVRFEATDVKSKKLKRNKIKYYKYYFLGKKHKTKKPYFRISTNTPKGLHSLRVKAYDKAGNKVQKTVVIRVR